VIVGIPLLDKRIAYLLQPFSSEVYLHLGLRDAGRRGDAGRLRLLRVPGPLTAPLQSAGETLSRE
jgi:hypothetical protein